MTHVRAVVAADHATVSAVVDAAFADGGEVSTLVADLRRSAGYRSAFELVAESESGEIIGHTMLTWNPVALDAGGERDVLVVSPLAVRPEAQRRGVGRALITAVVDLAREVGEPCVVLEGDPAYYARLGFEPAGRHGLRPAGPTTPEPAFQMLSTDSGRPAAGELAGRLRYDAAFWARAACGLPEAVDPAAGYPLPYLHRFANLCGRAEAALAGAGPAGSELAGAGGDRPVPSCPDWTLTDLVVHLGQVHRRVLHRCRTGVAPATLAEPDADVAAWFATGWRELYDHLASLPPTAPADGLTPDWTIGAWSRRQAHEIAVHLWDLLDALGPQDFPWHLDAAVAADGVGEVLDLVRTVRTARSLSADPGPAVRLEAVDVDLPASSTRTWTVWSGTAEDVDALARPAATVRGRAADLDLWLWGRADLGSLQVEGDPAAARSLRTTLATSLT